MATANDDIVQQLNRAVARASINPEDTFANIDKQIAERRREKKAREGNGADDKVSDSSVVIPSPTAVPSPKHMSPPITSPPSANNPFAKGPRASSSSVSTEQSSSSRGNANVNHDNHTKHNARRNNAASRQRYPPRSKVSPRVIQENGEDGQETDRTVSSRGRSRESGAVRRGSDSSNDGKYTHRGSDSSTGSDKASQHSQGEGGEGGSTEITPRTVQEVGTHSRRNSDAKNEKHKALLQSNDRFRRSSGDRSSIKSSASASSVGIGGRSSRVEERRGVHSAGHGHRNMRNNSNRRHDPSAGPDERSIKQLPPNFYSQPQSYYDEHGTGFNELGEEDGTWMCLRPSCGYITTDKDINYCFNCATVRGASGERGDHVRLSIQK